MFILQVITVFLVAVAMALSLAHALEYPGKMRLSKEAYLTTQSIYYPGFTIGGLSEGLSLVATLILLVRMPHGSDFFLVDARGQLATQRYRSTVLCRSTGVAASDRRMGADPRSMGVFAHRARRVGGNQPDLHYCGRGSLRMKLT